MNTYEAKRAARLERMRARRDKKLEIAEQNSMSNVSGERNTGIPLGQPILVGHHSERRHRKALERIDNKIRKGFEASAEAERLEQRIEAAESRKAIDSDNPDAENLLIAKIARLKDKIEHAKRINKLLRKFETIDLALAHYEPLKDQDNDAAYIFDYLNSRSHFYASRQIHLWMIGTTNAGAEIRRLQKRLDGLAKVQSFDGFAVVLTQDIQAQINVELVDGQIQVEFPFKPNEETRNLLKRSPLALKWSAYSKRWVRKHTETTASRYFKDELIKVLKGARP
jgi:uncharacterized protein DUF3560